VRTNVCEVLTHAHFAEKYWSIEDVIVRCAAAITPLSLDIIGGVIGANLLTVAINAAVRGINPCTALEHSRLWLWINIRSLFIGFRIEMSDLPVRNDREPNPRKGERAEDSHQKRSKALHVRLSSADWRSPLLGSRKRRASPFISGLRMAQLQPG
jgi:hypothetical protein